MKRANELGWDAADPTSWTLETTVDAHLGYHHTGTVMREYRTIRDAATDYEPAIDPADIDWWADVLPAIHAAKAAIAEASPERYDAAGAAVGMDANDYLSDADDLEIGADRARQIVRALAAS